MFDFESTKRLTPMKTQFMHTARTLSWRHCATPREGVPAIRSLTATLKRTGLALLAVFALLHPWHAAHAVGTPAGTSITNSATVNYSIAGVPATAVTSTVVVRVDELISVRVTPPASPANVNTPDTNKVLVFTVTNVGNGPEAYTLTLNLNPGAPVVDQFNPLPGSAGQLFVDVNSNGQLDIGVDTLVAGPLTLNADQSVRVLLVSNIPAALSNGDQGVVRLTATSTTVNAAPGGIGAPPGTILPNAGTPAVGAPGIDAVVGAGPGGAADSGADDAANGTYFVGTVNVTVSKVVLAVTSPFGATTTGCNAATPPAACTVFVPGTVIQYLVTMTISGNGTAQAVQFTDAIPANTTYVANSIRFNGAARTDAIDPPDNASCTGCGNAVGTVAVLVGDVPVVTGTPVIHNIDYKVSIN
jgi:uncharacterized repeat protein (TIGR01451 family)